MIDYHLSDAELRELRLAHRQAGEKREAYRINAVILLGSGWSVEQVSQALLIDADTVSVISIIEGAIFKVFEGPTGRSYPPASVPA